MSYKVAETLVERVRDEKWFIEEEVNLVKKLHYRLNPFTLYQEVSMLLAGFEKYFRSELSGVEGWQTQRNRVLWICEGIVME